MGTNIVALIIHNESQVQRINVNSNGLRQFQERSELLEVMGH